jgi:hypothetical protein
MKLRVRIQDVDELLPLLGGAVIGFTALAAVPFVRCASGGVEPSGAIRGACYTVALAAFAVAGFGVYLAVTKRSRRRSS